MAVTAAVIGAVAAVGSLAVGAVSLFSGGGGEQQAALPAPPELPAAPDPDQIRADQRKRFLQRQAGKTKTVLTSGLTEEATIAKPTLLGGTSLTARAHGPTDIL